MRQSLLPPLLWKSNLKAANGTEKSFSGGLLDDHEDAFLPEHHPKILSIALQSGFEVKLKKREKDFVE